MAARCQSPTKQRALQVLHHQRVFLGAPTAQSPSHRAGRAALSRSQPHLPTLCTPSPSVELGMLSREEKKAAF